MEMSALVLSMRDSSASETYLRETFEEQTLALGWLRTVTVSCFQHPIAQLMKLTLGRRLTGRSSLRRGHVVRSTSFWRRSIVRLCFGR